MPRLRKGPYAVAVLTVTLGLTGLLGPALGATNQTYPRILTVDTSQLPEVELEAVVPPLLAGRTLPATAFSVVEDGRRMPVSSAVHRPAADLRLMLVLDTAVAPDALAAQQGAMRDFLFELPDRAQVGLVAANPAPVVMEPAGTGRASTIRSLAGLQPRPGGAGDDTAALLRLALGHLPEGTGTRAVVMVDDHPAATGVPSELRRAAVGGDVTVYQIVLGDPPADYLGGLPDETGGRVLRVTEATRLLSAYGVVASELAGRYRVTYSTTTTEGSHAADLTVSSAGVSGTTTFVIDAGETPKPSPAGALKESTRRKTNSPTGRLVAGVVLALLLVRLAWRVARRA